MKRLLLWIHLAVSLALILTACSAEGLSFFPTPEPAKITLAVPNEYTTFYTARLEDFRKKEPKLTVELISTNISSSTPPDVSVNRWIDIYNQSGVDRLAKGLDLTPFLEQVKDFNRADYYPGLLEAYTRDGKLLGLPTGVDPFVMLYNQDLFDRYSVPYPKAGWTWSDFRTAAMQLRDPEARIYGYASTLNYIDCLFFVYQHGGSLVSGKTPTLDSQEAVQAVEWYGHLFGENGVAPTEDQIRRDFSGHLEAGIMQQQVGMWTANVSAVIGPSGKGWPFKIGIAPLPRDVTGFTVAQYEGLMISATTPSPQASWKLVSFLSSQSPPWMVPARLSLANSPAFATAMGKDHAEGAIIAMKDASLVSTFDLPTLSTVIGAFSQATQAVVEGKATALEALTAAQSAIQK